MAQYMYYINYQDYEADLCALEMRALFNKSIETKVFFSDQWIEESISPYIKSRLEVLHEATTFEELIQMIKENKYIVDAFKVQYVPVIKPELSDREQKKITKAVGYVIEGFPSFEYPEIIYGVTCYDNKWYFGIVVYNTMLWKKHMSKPNSYSSSLGLNTAKAILNVAAKGDVSKKIIDPCCGVGTVLLEGHYSGYDITGVEIKAKVAMKARENLEYFGYQGRVILRDIKDIDEIYDAAVVDLPYGNFSESDEGNMVDIIRHAARISERQVFISSVDLTDNIREEGLVIVDQSVVYKNKSRRFTRYIWVCEGSK
ncbi:MAG: SAM-dependent methyltransferase [Peptostreptococcaceae bacterium]|nr:SAM-dependent methyltransferase [Peptostreptococcaceae bacterium]